MCNLNRSHTSTKTKLICCVNANTLIKIFFQWDVSELRNEHRHQRPAIFFLAFEIKNEKLNRNKYFKSKLTVRRNGTHQFNTNRHFTMWQI